MGNEVYYGLEELLARIQEQLSRTHSDLFSDGPGGSAQSAGQAAGQTGGQTFGQAAGPGDARRPGDGPAMLRSLIGQALHGLGASVRGFTREALVERLYWEMAGYSILTPYLASDDLEEINVNSWDDVALTLRDGRIIKARDRFFSPSHAENIIRRLLRNSGMILDSSAPLSQGHLPGNNRITALRAPLVDAGAGVAVSIRLMHSSTIDLQTLIAGGAASPEMVSFMRMLCRYGVSFVIAGATSSGKTTLLNAILSDMPDDKRIFTIESGARELDLVRHGPSGAVTNNVVHTLSRPSENEKQDIRQEDLVVASLRYDPDIVCIGEMRDVECYAAVEAAMTGHTVVSTVHSGSGESAHMRIALLCQKKFPIEFRLSMLQAAEAFPVVVYCARNEDNVRRVLDISECVTDSSGGPGKYRSLYRFEPGSDGRPGRFASGSPASAALKRRLLEHGAPYGVLSQFRFSNE
jgi:pilus assembly protein CpaF